jgi:hypothetical protein
MGQAALDSGTTMEPAMQDTTMKAAEGSAARPQPWNARRFFTSLDFKTAGECVDQMAQHFLCVPLSAEQRTVLIDALGVSGGENASMSGRNVNPQNLMASLHLLLSTAEYQLC